MGDENLTDPLVGGSKAKPKEKKESSNDLLVKLASTGPGWVRAFALVILLLSAATPYWQQISKSVDEWQLNEVLKSTSALAQGNSQYAGGTPVPAPQDASNAVKDALNTFDAEHLSYHTATLEENPSFKRMLVSGRKGVLAYSVYPSDGCILIKHIKGGHIKTDLVRAEPTQSGQVASPWPDAAELKLNVNWMPEPSPQEVPDKTPVQGGCLNPHPGQFNYWVGSQNGCLQQVFRRFLGDGCTHYQMYNACNNLWDPEIHWTFCNNQHRF